MGAIAEAFAAFAQPLLDQTDGSEEQLNKAFSLSQLCYNLAMLPEDSRETMLSEMQQSLDMDDEEFDAFRREIVGPMIRRHETMFPGMHRRVAANRKTSASSQWADTRTVEPARTPPVTDRYAPCPCNSGRKYKFCCGAKGR